MYCKDCESRDLLNGGKGAHQCKDARVDNSIRYPDSVCPLYPHRVERRCENCRYRGEADGHGFGGCNNLQVHGSYTYEHDTCKLSFHINFGCRFFEENKEEKPKTREIKVIVKNLMTGEMQEEVRHVDPLKEVGIESVTVIIK